MDKKYAAILRRFSPYADAAEDFCRRHADASRHTLLTAQVTAPVLFSYVWYVLGQAERMGLKRLYFLSESGNAMLAIAREIARVCPVSLELRYLYCSDTALRLPVLHRIDTEEAISELFRRSSLLTLDRILRRAAFTAEQRQALRTELVLPEDRRLLRTEEYDALCVSLRSSVKFRNIMTENSRSAHAAALGYLMQEGMADGTAFGIVHAGWTCSVQRYLRMLSEEIHPVTGFYFALRTRPKAAADGTCHTWYFSEESSAGLRTKFCWPLFRNMCAPPHGRTIGYQQDAQGVCTPVLSEKHPDETLAEAQIAICQEFAALCAGSISYPVFPVETLHRISEQLLTGLMFHPTAEEAGVFSRFTEDGIPLIPLQDKTALRECLQHPQNRSALLWKYGALAVSGLHGKQLRRFLMQKQDAIHCLLNEIRFL